MVSSRERDERNDPRRMQSRYPPFEKRKEWGSLTVVQEEKGSASPSIRIPGRGMSILNPGYKP